MLSLSVTYGYPLESGRMACRLAAGTYTESVTDGRHHGPWSPARCSASPEYGSIASEATIWSASRVTTDTVTDQADHRAISSTINCCAIGSRHLSTQSRVQQRKKIGQVHRTVHCSGHPGPPLASHPAIQRSVSNTMMAGPQFETTLIYFSKKAVQPKSAHCYVLFCKFYPHSKPRNTFTKVHLPLQQGRLVMHLLQSAGRELAWRCGIGGGTQLAKLSIPV
jgi:hypothetical protein